MKAQFYKDLGLWLRKHRQQCGYSIGQVSDKTGISNATYTFYEKGAKKMTLLDFVLLCRVLKTDFRYNGSFRLEPEEMEMVEALRRKDIKRVLQREKASKILSANQRLKRIVGPLGIMRA